jgi:hypothetical protein
MALLSLPYYPSAVNAKVFYRYASAHLFGPPVSSIMCPSHQPDPKHTYLDSWRPLCDLLSERLRDLRPPGKGLSCVWYPVLLKWL